MTPGDPTMSTATIVFILYALTGSATLTPIAQYQSKDACQTVETMMNTAVGDASFDNARFKCIDAQTMVDMLGKNGVDVN